MQADKQQELVKTLKGYVLNEFPLSQLKDEELKAEIQKLVLKKLAGETLLIDEKIAVAEEIYSSIRGFGVLDGIMKDDSITEVMINGYQNIFVEQKGRVHKLDMTFEDTRRLEDVIQRIVGQAGREVNQANPIVDTRLPNGSRVNVVLPPISLVGPVVTIRKFSKNPMTIERLIAYGSLTQPKEGAVKPIVPPFGRKSGMFIDTSSLCSRRCPRGMA